MKKKLPFLAILAIIVAAMFSATLPINAHKKENLEQNQTEVLSKEASASLRSIVMPPQTSVPVVHSAILDKNMRKFATSEQFDNYTSKLINNLYDKNGSFLGAALIQAEIDKFSFFAFFSDNTDTLGKNVNPELTQKIKGFGDAFYKNITPYEEAINDWSDRYFNNLHANLKFDHKPSAKEVNDRIDTYVENSNFSKFDKIQYNKIINDNKLNIIGNSDTATEMNNIALKIKLIDMLSITRVFHDAGITGSNADTFKDDTGKDVYYYLNNWMWSTAPITNK